MRALSSSLRKQLETSVLAARRVGESASRSALDGLGVFLDRRPEHLDARKAALRNGLRAKLRQLGSDRELLVAECAYEQWHKLLFARFLAENGVLLHPQYKAPVTLADCDELAAELGEPDAWSVAARFAAEILPGIFRLDDPCVALRLPPEGRHALEQILDAIPAETFAADDSLGWVYQFWQKDKKDEVNASERKIGGADLGPVTQLFTDNYMVRFLLENSLGAWWAVRHPDSPLVKTFDYLRFDDNGHPVAGSFEGWPDRVAEVTVMDPCCGSGHFLVEAFSMLWQMRVEEEGLSPVVAQDAVLRVNLFGLELDSRCVQIAMFAVALQAWKAGGEWRQLPVPNIACSGMPVKASLDEWKALACGDVRLENALARLHILFRDAETLGSLIDPRRATEFGNPTEAQRSLDDVDWTEIAPLLVIALSTEQSDPAAAVLGADAAGLLRAATLLSGTYTLIATNVPYLGRGKQCQTLLSHIEWHYPTATLDLAGAMQLRSLRMAAPASGVVATITPQTWTYLSWWRQFRQTLLNEHGIELVAKLGPRAFEGISGEVVQVVLAVVRERPFDSRPLWIVDLSELRAPADKAAALREAQFVRSSVAEQRAHLESRLLADSGSGVSLGEVASVFAGSKPGQTPRVVRNFWEIDYTNPIWMFMSSVPDGIADYAGKSLVILRPDEMRRLGVTEFDTVGAEARGRRGVLIAKMGDLPSSLYDGSYYDDNTYAFIPNQAQDLMALFMWTRSDAFRAAVRSISQKAAVPVGAVTAAKLDVDRWRVAAEGTGQVPEPWSADSTQWLFEGRPDVSSSPLQVAVARLVGYRWPKQAESDDLDTLADPDGIVCLPAVAGEAPAADRVQQLLAASFGERWSPAKLKELIQQAGSKKKSLADWLRDEFFKEHGALFANRPFVWHIWDGQRDGFSALVNYHRLDRRSLEKLTYTYLGQDWVERQRAGLREEVPGAAARLTAALVLQKRLEEILEGEAPLDIYVRWKQTHEQPIGWEPDLNDGVRLNIRPFVEAGVLRAPFNVHWRKDRGKNPDGTERLNDIHLTLAEKLEARRKAGRA
jgi:hypothetical protein